MRFTLLFIVWIMIGLSGVRAADIRAISSRCFLTNSCEQQISDAIIIRGAISKGDAKRFRAVILESGLAVTSVILRSEGGDVEEAMEIGRDVRNLLLETEGPVLDYFRDSGLNYSGGDYPLCVENGVSDFKGSRFKGTNCICASACFLVYVSGVRRNLSYLGIHRAYVGGESAGEMDLSKSMNIYQQIKKPIASYLDQMGVPRLYTDIMLQTASTELYHPKYVEVKRDFYGWIPEIEEWLINKCSTITERQLADYEEQALSATDRSKFLEYLEYQKKREECIFTVLLEERISAKRC